MALTRRAGLAVDLALLRLAGTALRRAVLRLPLRVAVGLALLRLALAGVRLAVLRLPLGVAVHLALLRRALTLLLRVAALLGRTVLTLRAGALRRVRLVRAAVDLPLLGAVRAVLRAGLRRHRAGTLTALRVRVPVALLRRALAVGGRERSGRRALAGVRLAVLLGAVRVLARRVLAGLLRTVLLLRRLRVGGLLRGGIGRVRGRALSGHARPRRRRRTGPGRRAAVPFVGALVGHAPPRLVPGLVWHKCIANRFATKVWSRPAEKRMRLRVEGTGWASSPPLRIGSQSETSPRRQGFSGH
ncbi:hypothetical protein Cci01nite_04730 [Catellatospora citrea]|uniref:Uncharacterized protein n=1 Tax=Catellatospora citrea TaxID=53366 RepID=A0A8J3KHV9_9ACTN|nr:hypothetical protein Cci01nite_04730 [Catellatospora citrea]